MTRLKLRTFSIAVLLVSATLGMSLNFSESVLTGADREFNESSDIKQLRSGFADQSSEFESTRPSAQETSIQTDFFFLREVWNIMSTVVGGLTDIQTLFAQAVGISGLAVPEAVSSLFGVAVIGVVFAVVAAARGWDV
jgi:hypothetical protein